MEKYIESHRNVKAIEKISESDFWNDIPPEIKHAINQAKEELDRGKGIPHSQIIGEIKDRFLNK